MTYDEADNLILEHIDYGGVIDRHALAIAISTAPTTGSAPEQWKAGDDTSSVQISRDGSTHKWGCKCGGCATSTGSAPEPAGYAWQSELDKFASGERAWIQLWRSPEREAGEVALYAAPPANAPVASGSCLIVKATGETDLPVVHIVHSLEEARHAVLSLMYSDPADAEDADELFAEFDDTMADDNYWSIAFEIGGISVERVCLDVALLAASMGGDKS